ncbi:MAG: hypothetical protein OEW30_19975 [Acidimicrobiia bacterium]|nr:hypothetical protein [Acidimicrobiia bacterium]
MKDPTDDEMVEELRAALTDARDGGPDMVDMIMTGYDLTVTDALVARIVEAGEPVAMRSDADGPRFVVCEGGGVTVSFEIVDGTIVGDIHPVSGTDLFLEQALGTTTVDVSTTGAFEATLPSRAPFRLRYQPIEADPIVTEWILP